MAYPNTNVFILCFSVVDPDSYSNILSKWIPELNRMYLKYNRIEMFSFFFL
jgi:GTPase SAR1 family protein